MLNNLFQTKPVLDSGTSDWIFDTFAWAIENFELNVFKQDTQLILPNNDFYPGKVSSVHQMAQSIFDLTLKYAGMENWPIRLVEPQNYQQQPLAKIHFSNAIRGGSFQLVNEPEQETIIEITYNPNQINQPQDLIASFGQTLASILILQSDAIPPGGKDNLPQAADLVACFMGFGVMFANTAYQFKGGCGSCYNPAANRQVALAELDVAYCLALFSVLKSIPVKQVLPHLKLHLKKTFKQAHKEIQAKVKLSPQPALLAALN
ncbi:MAG: hypothetical protein HRT38_20945 [Alteromonadaceae bacterium]|nr:hypothetical protein [Alteromonadaceae bacterium]